MKGLLLKDWYMLRTYCRSYLLIAAGFLVLSLVGNDNLFFVFYPCLLCGMIPVNLLGYDERSRWMQYSGTLPYTKRQLVSAKYLTGLLAQAAMISVLGLAHGIKLHVTGQFALGKFAVFLLLLLVVSTFISSISLPFLFKLGVEKGKIAYYVMLGFVCAASILASGLLSGRLVPAIPSPVLLSILAAAGVGAYILSWALSVAFFRRREIQ